MRELDGTVHIAYIACMGLAILASTTRPARASALPIPTGKRLTATITALDAKLFAAYNDCDLVSFALWEYRHGTWLLSIVFSYDHHTVTPAGARKAVKPES